MDSIVQEAIESEDWAFLDNYKARALLRQKIDRAESNASKGLPATVSLSVDDLYLLQAAIPASSETSRNWMPLKG